MFASSMPSILNFYPRPPRGGRLSVHPLCIYCRNFYPRPPRGGRRAVLRDGNAHKCISIHALREEGDHITAGRR